ncbi:MAG TPA: DUF4912 domain-containing protein [Bacillota bacterium]|nr:DUF4912 domain-containing protein [Bacillota bacterium]
MYFVKGKTGGLKGEKSLNTLIWLLLTLMLVGALTLIMAPNFLLGPSRKPIKSRSSHDFETAGELGLDLDSTGEFPIPLQPRTSFHGKLTALVRSPRSLYVYWESEEWPEGVMTLRLNKRCEFSGETILLREIPLHGDTDNWYFGDLTSNTCYWVELGLLSPDGHSSILLTSEELVTPRDTVSSKIDPDWQPLSGLNFGFGINVSSSSLLRKD